MPNALSTYFRDYFGRLFLVNRKDAVLDINREDSTYVRASFVDNLLDKVDRETSSKLDFLGEEAPIAQTHGFVVMERDDAPASADTGSQEDARSGSAGDSQAAPPQSPLDTFVAGIDFNPATGAQWSDPVQLLSHFVNPVQAQYADFFTVQEAKNADSEARAADQADRIMVEEDDDEAVALDGLASAPSAGHSVAPDSHAGSVADQQEEQKRITFSAFQQYLDSVADNTNPKLKKWIHAALAGTIYAGVFGLGLFSPGLPLRALFMALGIIAAISNIWLEVRGVRFGNFGIFDNLANAYYKRRLIKRINKLTADANANSEEIKKALLALTAIYVNSGEYEYDPAAGTFKLKEGSSHVGKFRFAMAMAIGNGIGTAIFVTVGVHKFIYWDALSLAVAPGSILPWVIAAVCGALMGTASVAFNYRFIKNLFDKLGNNSFFKTLIGEVDGYKLKSHEKAFVVIFGFAAAAAMSFVTVAAFLALAPLMGTAGALALMGLLVLPVILTQTAVAWGAVRDWAYNFGKQDNDTWFGKANAVLKAMLRGSFTGLVLFSLLASSAIVGPMAIALSVMLGLIDFLYCYRQYRMAEPNRDLKGQDWKTLFADETDYIRFKARFSDEQKPEFRLVDFIKENAPKYLLAASLVGSGAAFAIIHAGGLTPAVLGMVLGVAFAVSQLLVNNQGKDFSLWAYKIAYKHMKPDAVAKLTDRQVLEFAKREHPGDFPWYMNIHDRLVLARKAVFGFLAKALIPKTRAGRVGLALTVLAATGAAFGAMYLPSAIFWPMLLAITLISVIVVAAAGRSRSHGYNKLQGEDPESAKGNRAFVFPLIAAAIAFALAMATGPFAALPLLSDKFIALTAQLSTVPQIAVYAGLGLALVVVAGFIGCMAEKAAGLYHKSKKDGAEVSHAQAAVGVKGGGHDYRPLSTNAPKANSRRSADSLAPEEDSSSTSDDFSGALAQTDKRTAATGDHVLMMAGEGSDDDLYGAATGHEPGVINAFGAKATDRNQLTADDDSFVPVRHGV